MVTGEPYSPVRHTWREVHERARRIAGGLAAEGIGHGDAVGVLAGAPVEIAPTAQGLWMRGASLTDPEKLLEGTGKGVRHVKLRNVADVKKPGVKNLVVEAATLNRKDPPSGMMVGMEKRKRKNN